MSLAERMHFLYCIYSKWPPLRWWHILIRRAKLPIILTYSFFGSSRIFWFDLSHGLWIVLIYVVFQEPQETKNRGASDRVNVETTWDRGVCWSAYQWIDGRATPSWCRLYVELPHLVRTIAYLDSLQDMLQVPSRTCSAHQCKVLLLQLLPPCLCFQVKTVRLFYVLGDYPACAFHGMQKLLRPSTLNYCYWHVHGARSVLSLLNQTPLSISWFESMLDLTQNNFQESRDWEYTLMMS